MLYCSCFKDGLVGYSSGIRRNIGTGAATEGNLNLIFEFHNFELYARMKANLCSVKMCEENSMARSQNLSTTKLRIKVVIVWRFN